MQYVVENANKIVPLVFALLAAMGLAGVILAGFFGRQLTGEVFDLLKSVIQISLGGGIGSGAVALAPVAVRGARARARSGENQDD